MAVIPDVTVMGQKRCNSYAANFTRGYSILHFADTPHARRAQLTRYHAQLAV